MGPSIVVLVEGPSERVLINYLIDTGRIAVPKGGVFVLDCMGKLNIHRFMNLLGALKTAHCVLVDGDNNRKPHDKIMALIEKTRNPYTHGIKAFPKDLEDFLGIDTTASHRKPQHIMFRLHEGKIKDENMARFIELINGLMS